MGIGQNKDTYVVAAFPLSLHSISNGNFIKVNRFKIGKSINLYTIPKLDVLYFEKFGKYVFSKNFKLIINAKSFFASVLIEEKHFTNEQLSIDHVADKLSSVELGTPKELILAKNTINLPTQQNEELANKYKIDNLTQELEKVKELVDETTTMKFLLEENISVIQYNLANPVITPEYTAMKMENNLLQSKLESISNQKHELQRLESIIISNFQNDVVTFLKDKISLSSKNYIIKQGIKPNNIEEVSISDFNTLDEKLRGNLLSFGMKEEYVKGYTRFIITSALTQGNFIICGSYYKEVADSLSLLLTGKSAGQVYLDQGASYGADLLKAIGDMPDKVLLIHHALDTYNESLFLSLIKEEREKIFFFTYEKEAHSSSFSTNVGKMVYFLDVDPFFAEPEKSPLFTGIFDIQSLIPEIELTSKEIPNQLLEILPESSFELISTFLNLQKQVYQNGKITFTLLRSIKFCVEESVFDQYIQELSKTPSLKGLVAKWKL